MDRKSTKRPIAVDLFCGAGGMSLGFEQAGFDVRLGVDLDGYHVATHERNFPYGKSLCQSVSELKSNHVFESCESEDIDVVVGGPPCQGFSNMGLRDQLDPRNTLVAQFARIVAEVRPKAFVMENVPGMLAGSTRAVLDDALMRFEKAGYRVATPLQILDASHFGVPQRRKRLIVLGVRSDVADSIAYPSANDAFETPTVAQAIEDLPDINSDESLWTRNFTIYRLSPKSEYALRMRGMLVDPDDFSHPRDWDPTVCTGCLRVRHTPQAIELYRSTPPGTMVPSHKLPRLDPDGIAPTLRAGSDSTHGSYTAPRPIHPFQPRCITVREAARLHGYPDWFAFYPLKWHAYRQIGNSVCPPVAKAIGEGVRTALKLKPRKPSALLAMSDEYHLPAHRPRSLKRIPQMVHFPPVIDWLFQRRYDMQSSRLSQSEFTFDEVLQAVKNTGVTLDWIRADTFLNEIARSRNVKRLLEPCLKYGFSIRKILARKSIGEFVPCEHPDAIDRRLDGVPITRTTTLARKEDRRGQKRLFD